MISLDDKEKIFDGPFKWQIARIKKETTKDKIRGVLQLVND